MRVDNEESPVRPTSLPPPAQKKLIAKKDEKPINIYELYQPRHDKALTRRAPYLKAYLARPHPKKPSHSAIKVPLDALHVELSHLSYLKAHFELLGLKTKQLSKSISVLEQLSTSVSTDLAAGLLSSLQHAFTY